MTILRPAFSTRRGSKGVAIDKNLAAKIPFLRCYEEEGIIETTAGNFSKTYIIGEIDMDQIERTSQASARQVMQGLMNSFHGNVSYEFTTYNRLIDQDSYLKQILIMPGRDPGNGGWESRYCKRPGKRYDRNHKDPQMSCGNIPAIVKYIGGKNESTGCRR